MLTHQQLRTMALAVAAFKAKFDKLCDEFSLLSEFLLARTSQGLTQTRGTVSKKFNEVCG